MSTIWDFGISFKMLYVLYADTFIKRSKLLWVVVKKKFKKIYVK